MRSAKRVDASTNEPSKRTAFESSAVLDPTAILECLETDLWHDEPNDGDPIVGIRNSIVIGTLLWIILLAPFIL
jgi:hypothetical protein